jgi:NADPH-dependent curcumin reductase
MPQEPTLNQRIVLVSRPHGAPTPENFRLERVSLPELADGQVLLKTLYLSLDPYMRGRMSDAPSYAAPVEIDEVMTGGAVSRIEQSRHPEFEVGDLVVGATGWQSHSISDGRNLMPVPKGLPSPSSAVMWWMSLALMPVSTTRARSLPMSWPKPASTVWTSTSRTSVAKYSTP